MTGKRFVSILTASLLLLPVYTSTLLAGVEPSPFQPEINQLGAIANMLDSAYFRVDRTLSVPPEPCVPPDPCKGLNGDINRLEAIENQVSSTDNMVDSMINEVMGFEPTPFREDLVPALEVVGEAAQGIADRINTFVVETSAEEVAIEFIYAVEAVGVSALIVVDTVDDGIEQLLGGPVACEDIEDENTCNARDLCEWDPGDFCFTAE